MPRTDLLQGTLDVLILKILALGPDHGWGVSTRLRQISRDGLRTTHGSLYPALHRLEVRSLIESEMTVSENNRKVRMYRITRAGRQRLESEARSWERFAASMRRVLRAT